GGSQDDHELPNPLVEGSEPVWPADSDDIEMHQANQIQQEQCGRAHQDTHDLLGYGRPVREDPGREQGNRHEARASVRDLVAEPLRVIDDGAEGAGTRTAATAIWPAEAAVSVVLPRLCAVTIASATPAALVGTEPGDTEAMLGFAVANNTSSPATGAPPRVSVARAVAVWAGS